MHFSLPILAVVSVVTAVTDVSCKNKPYTQATCCENKMKHLDKYNGDFLSYDCSYKHYAKLNDDGGIDCVSPAKLLCCNDKEGWITPLGGPFSFEHSEPEDFRCEGISTGVEDPPA